jgi:hypothetical protein
MKNHHEKSPSVDELTKQAWSRVMGECMMQMQCDENKAQIVAMEHDGAVIAMVWDEIQVVIAKSRISSSLDQEPPTECINLIGESKDLVAYWLGSSHPRAKTP